MGAKNKKTQSEKWKFAIGTTSRVPGCKGFHYLILDIDGKKGFDKITNQLDEFGCDYVTQDTEHGWHIYTDLITSLKECVLLAGMLGADRNWIRIAEGRGYFYLADKRPMNFAWPVERMVIYRGKKETQDTTRP